MQSSISSCLLAEYALKIATTLQGRASYCSRPYDSKVWPCSWWAWCNLDHAISSQQSPKLPMFMEPFQRKDRFHGSWQSWTTQLCTVGISAALFFDAQRGIPGQQHPIRVCPERLDTASCKLLEKECPCQSSQSLCLGNFRCVELYAPWNPTFVIIGRWPNVSSDSLSHPFAQLLWLVAPRSKKAFKS